MGQTTYVWWYFKDELNSLPSCHCWLRVHRTIVSRFLHGIEFQRCFCWSNVEPHAWILLWSCMARATIWLTDVLLFLTPMYLLLNSLQESYEWSTTLIVTTSQYVSCSFSFKCWALRGDVLVALLWWCFQCRGVLKTIVELLLHAVHGYGWHAHVHACIPDFELETPYEVTALSIDNCRIIVTFWVRGL